MHTNAFRRSVVTIAAIGSVAVGGISLANAAFAMPSGQKECDAADLNFETAERVSPNEGSRLFEMTVTAKPGVSCELGGAPSNVAFVDPTGTPLGVEIEYQNPGGATPVTVDETHPKALYLVAPDSPQTGAPASMISFDLPSDGPNTEVTTSWPSSINGPVTVGNFGDFYG